MAALASSCFGARAPAFSARPTRRPQGRPAAHVVPSAWGQLRGGPLHGGSDDGGAWRSLFAASFLPPTENPPGVLDARDALETCAGLWGEQRTECLTVFGLDAERLDAYYSTVWLLEEALTHDTDPDEEAYHRGQERC